MKTITLSKDQQDLLLMGMRYLEMNHPIWFRGKVEINHRPEFKDLLNELYKQFQQQGLLDEEKPPQT